MRPLRGIALKILAMMLFITTASLVKATADVVPAGQAVFFRSFFALPVILAWLALRRELITGLRISNPLGHVWRGVLGTTAMGLGFAGLAFLPLPEATAIGFSAPILTVVFAAMFLGEPLRAFRLGAVGLGMAGVTIVLWPRLSLGADLTSGAALGALLVFMSAVFIALAQVALRRLVVTETTPAIVFWFSITASLLSLLSVPFGWILPAPQTVALLVLAGVAGGLAQVCLTSSYRMAEVSVVAPFGYVQILFSLAIGYWVFSETPSLSMIYGAFLVIIGGVLIIWHERNSAAPDTRQKPAATPDG